MGTERGNMNLSGLPMYHLRRIGPPPKKDRVTNVMDLYKVTYMIGRSEVQVDFYIDSSNHIQSASISRCHARVVRQNGNQHRLYDDSLNGVFVNNMKIAGSCVLREGDKVTFGHPCGARLPPGSRSRQPDSHHQFMFEMCNCELAEQNLKDVKEDNRKERSRFKKPVSPVEASCSDLKKPSRPARKPTQCFTSDDIRHLKQVWEDKQASSASDTSDVEDSASVAEKETKVTIENKNITENGEEPAKISISKKQESVVTETSNNNGSDSIKKLTSRIENEGINKDRELAEDIQLKNDSDGDKPSDENDNNHGTVENETSLSIVSNENSEKESRFMQIETNTENDITEHNDVACNSFTREIAENNDLSTLEGTVNSLMKDLSDLRGKIENSVEQPEHQVPNMLKSPTKDACIQTTQAEKLENSSDQTKSEGTVILKSPTKDACIQTSQTENENGGVTGANVTPSPVKDIAIQTSQLFPSQHKNDTLDKVVDENFPRSINIVSEDGDSNDKDVEMNVDECFQACMQSDIESKVMKDLERNDDKPVDGHVEISAETADQLNDLEDEDFIGKSDETLKKYIELAEECCSEQAVPAFEFSGKPKSEEKGMSDEDKSTDKEDIGLLLSNSIEYSDNESDRNLSDSESEEADVDKEDSVDSEEDEKDDDDGGDYENGNHFSIDTTKTDDDLKGNCSDLEGGLVAFDLTENATNENSIDGSDSDKTCRLHAGDKSKLETVVNKSFDCACDNEVNDSVNIDHTVERKRKNSEESILEMKSSSLRKRHCSDTANVLTEDKDECVADDSSSVSSNVSDDDSISSSQLGLKKLKKGVKKFFKFWSKKSYEMNTKNEIKDGGYIYLQDHSGDYKLLDIDSLSGITLSKDVEGTDSEQKVVLDQPQSEKASSDHCKNSLSNEIEETDYMKDVGSNDCKGGDLGYSDGDMETSVSGKNVGGKNMAVNGIDKKQDKSEAVEVKGGLETDENEIKNLERDIVESSMHCPDTDIDTNEICRPNILSAVFRTPSKHASKKYVEKSLLTSPILNTCSNHHVSSQSQSPIIAKQGVQIDEKRSVVNTKSSSTKLFDTECKADDLSELSCKFSDDDNDFFSPEIDFSNLDDSDDNVCDGDNDICDGDNDICDGDDDICDGDDDICDGDNDICDGDDDICDGDNDICDGDDDICDGDDDICDGDNDIHDDGGSDHTMHDEDNDINDGGIDFQDGDDDICDGENDICDNDGCETCDDNNEVSDGDNNENRGNDNSNDSEIDSDQKMCIEVEENVEHCKITEVDADVTSGISKVDKKCKKMVDLFEKEFNGDIENDEDEEDESMKENKSDIETDDDPLENFINHDTEENDDDSESTDTDKGDKPNDMNEIDFDFCDSEIEETTAEVSLYGKCKSTVIDSEDDVDVHHKSNGKRISKRKCDSDLEDRSPKKQKSPAVNEAFDDNLSRLKRKNVLSTPSKTPLLSQNTKHLRASISNQNSPFTSSHNLHSPMTLDQTQELDNMSMTQVTNVTEQLEKKVSDTSKSEASRNKAKVLLEKLKAKRRIKEEAADSALSSSPVPGTSASTEIEHNNRTDNREKSQTQLDLEAVNKHVNSCRNVIMKMKAMFDSSGSLQGNPRVEAWKKELLDIEKKLQFPKTVIAVVGDTGSGKSSLMNAILDHRSVLPTSGIRACTAVVVEVMNNTNSQYFEADIEFLQRQEWMEELQVLLKDLTGLDGTVKNRPPDPTSDAYVSYCKVKAVYGRIDKFEVLARLTSVTHWLGRIKVLKSTKPGEFRRQVEKYIETQEPGSGGQYWPIVKHVRLRMPNCDVCSSGASLVDLPGVRDSNAARDKIAKEYLKNCTAVWVVSSIHRAIDDKTAKDLLGENFRRQLLMDGQYGSIAFVCTKTDVLMPSEIIRPLELEDQTKEHEDKINEMESEKTDLELTISNATKEARTLKKTIAVVKTEAKELRDNLTELSNLIDSSDLDNSQSDEREAIEEYEKELKEKVDELNAAENRMDELHDQKLEATQKILELEKILGVHRKAISAICARARNEYSKKQIKRDFKAGLKEMRRRAGMLNDDNDEEDDIYSDDEDNDVGSHAENLKVFCCSSTEYQKMKNLLTDDGPPQVFSSLEDTQIPALRKYVHEMTSVRHKQWVERLIRNVGRFVFDLNMYMTEGGDMKSRDRAFAKTAIDTELQKFDTSLAPVFAKLMSDIDGVFDGSIRQKVEEGATNAATEANVTCSKWGAPVNRDKTKDKRSGGLHWATYRAAVRRQGVFTSQSWGPIDFNEDLSEPMYRNMTIVWDKAFSGLLWRILDKLKQDILVMLKKFLDELKQRLEKLGIQSSKTVRVTALLLSSAVNKLTEMVAYLKEIITNKQREISRLITPIVQANLLPEYMTGAAESGPGTYMRIKTCMSNGIDIKRFTMFDEASQQLMMYLVELQNEIMQYVKQVCQTLIQDLRTSFEPLWEAPANTSVIRSALRQGIAEVCLLMHGIYDEAGLTHLEETPLMTANTNNVKGNTSSVMTTSCNSGTLEAGGVGMMIKTERLSQSCKLDTVGSDCGSGTLYIKQEKKQEDIEGNISAVDGPMLNFGCQTLQDINCGKLEVSPVEIIVKTTPSTSSRPNTEIMPSYQPNSIGFTKPGHIVAPFISGNCLETNAQSSDNSRPAYQVTLSTGQKVLLLNKPISSTVTILSKPNVSNTFLNSTGIQSTSSMITKSNLPNSNLLKTFATKVCEGSIKQQQTPANKAVVGVKHQTPVLKSNQGQSFVPTLNMVFGKENLSLTPSSSHGLVVGRQLGSSSSSQHTPKKGKVVKLSRSQKNSPVQIPSPSPVIKKEPINRGVYGRVKDLGTIDLTDD